ncbi:MAG: diaminopimelate decarboxylase [candidate division WOR-3 bacterium]
MKGKWLATLKGYLKSGDGVDTPCYFYDREKIEENIRILKRNFNGIASLFFAVKANTNLAILRLIRNQCICAEVVSPGEIFICQKAGFHGSEILYNNVARREDEVLYAIENGVTFFNFESINQAIILEKMARSKGKKLKTYARINPGIFPKTHPHLSTGSEASKFGIRMRELPEIVKVMKKFRYTELTGIHCHIGSQILSPHPFIDASKKVIEAINFFRKNGFDISSVNLGGGFGIPYGPEDNPLDFKPIIDCYKALKKQYNIEIVLEPGRFFVANAGYILTRLIDKKQRNHLPIYMIDAGMTENPRPALYGAYHHIEPLFEKRSKKFKVRVTGPLCENADEFGVFNLPELDVGDYLLIQNSGAYTRTMASTYNGRVLPAEYLVDNKIILIRKKQQLRGLIENEQYQGI